MPFASSAAAFNSLGMLRNTQEHGIEASSWNRALQRSLPRTTNGLCEWCLHEEVWGNCLVPQGQ